MGDLPATAAGVGWRERGVAFLGEIKEGMGCSLSSGVTTGKRPHTACTSEPSRTAGTRPSSPWPFIMTLMTAQGLRPGPRDRRAADGDILAMVQGRATRPRRGARESDRGRLARPRLAQSHRSHQVFWPRPHLSEVISSAPLCGLIFSVVPRGRVAKVLALSDLGRRRCGILRWIVD